MILQPSGQVFTDASLAGIDTGNVCVSVIDRGWPTGGKRVEQRLQLDGLDEMIVAARLEALVPIGILTDGASVQLGDSADERQPEPQPALRTIEGAIVLREQIE